MRTWLELRQCGVSEQRAKGEGAHISRALAMVSSQSMVVKSRTIGFDEDGT